MIQVREDPPKFRDFVCLLALVSSEFILMEVLLLTP